MWYVLMARYLGPCYQAPCHRLQKSGEGMVHSRVDHSHVPGILDWLSNFHTDSLAIDCSNFVSWSSTMTFLHFVYLWQSLSKVIQNRLNMNIYYGMHIYPVYNIVMIKFVKPVDSCKVFMNPSCCFCMALSGGWSFQLFLLKLLVWCVCCKFQDIFVIYVALPQV